MKKALLIFAMVILCSGCSSLSTTGKPTLLHEQSEPTLMSKEEFMERADQSAILIYEGMRTINEAAKQYAIDNNGTLPPGTVNNVKKLLLEGGYIEKWPEIPPFAFTDLKQFEFVYYNGFADMDGIGADDDVMYAQYLKLEVCNKFIRRYSSAGPEDVIYDYEAQRERYPGEVFGRHMKIYAINWYSSSEHRYCDIEWVVKYND